MARAGLVHLADLVHRYAWEPLAIARAIETLGLTASGPVTLDESARDAAPTLVLGPSHAARYAVDLARPVVRITGTAPGQGAAVVLRDLVDSFAVFWREDLATGHRRSLGALRGQPLTAVPVPWTQNAVLVTEHGGDLQLELV